MRKSFPPKTLGLKMTTGVGSLISDARGPFGGRPLRADVLSLTEMRMPEIGHISIP